MNARPRSAAEPIELLGIALEPGHEHPGPKLDLGLSLSTTKAHGLIAYWRLRRSPSSTPSTADDDAGEASVVDALVFAKAIAALHRHSDLLPARLGTGFTNTAALCRHLDEEHPTYRDALARIRGCTEIALRIDLKTAEVSPDKDDGASPDLGASTTGAGRGRAYLLARRAEEHRRQALKDAAAELAGELQEALRGLVREQRAELVDDRAGQEAVAVALLVDRAQLTSLHSALSDWLQRGDHRGIADGPLAPYSFVEPAQAAPPTR